MVEEDRLEIYALGGLRLLRGGRPMRDVRLRKAQALLVYLAGASGPQSREKLANLFWGESPQERAMANLRDALHVLRKHLGPVLHITRHAVGLNPGARLWLDSAELESALAAARKQEGVIDLEIARSLEQAVKLYRGDLLEGFHLRGAPDFEHWLVVERERLRQAVLDGLYELVEFHIAQASYKTGIHYARRILQLEPLMEAGHRQLMRLLAASGQRGAALAHYESYRQTLMEELGAEPTEETRELHARLLRDEQLPGFPAGPPRHNLPAQPTSFIGREKELMQIAEQLRDPACRLLTLVGVGGIGKTRLALQAAAGAVDRYPDGVWQVRLAALNQADLLPQEVAAALGVSAQEAKSGRQVADVLVDYLREKCLLLVLDNCEHLIEACASLAGTLLRGCPQLQLLATSRESFDVPGERKYSVPALEFPPEQAPPRRLESYAAVWLFVERAGAVRPGFRLTEDNGAALARICRSLDGVPLAIELAAARVRVLSLEQIAERLKDRFQLLTGGPRTALPRHQTLRATMDWSYSLLSEPERAFLRRLSVFPGGWSLEAAEEVVHFGEATNQSALDLLTQLVDKSLVVVEARRRGAHYCLLETVRQYGAEKLSEAGETRKTGRRHAAFFVRLAEQADPELRGSRQVDWLETLDLEHDNLRAALGWCVREREADLAYRLVGALGWFWFMRGHWKEAQRWLNSVLDLTADSDPGFRAKAIIRAGGMELVRGNLYGTVERVEEALDICRTIGDDEGAAWCLNFLGQGLTYLQERIEEAIPLLSDSVEIFNSLGNDWGVAWSTRYLAQVADIKGDYERSVILHEKALNGFEENGDTWNTAHSAYLLGLTAMRNNKFGKARQAFEKCRQKCRVVKDGVIAPHARMGLARVALYQKESDRAHQLFGEALDPLQKIGDETCVAGINRDLALISLHGGDFEQAAEYLEKSLRSFEKLRSKDNVVWVLERFAALSGAMGNGERAARLLGAADIHLGAMGNLPPMYRVEMEQQVISTRDLLEKGAFEPLFAEGAAMSLEEAVAYALEVTGEL